MVKKAKSFSTSYKTRYSKLCKKPCSTMGKSLLSIISIC